MRIPPYSSTTQRAWEAATKKRRLQIEESDPGCVRQNMKKGGFWLTDKTVGAWQLKRKSNAGMHAPRAQQLWAFISYDCPPEGTRNRLDKEIHTFNDTQLAKHWSLHVLRGPQYMYCGMQCAVALFVGRVVPAVVVQKLIDIFKARAAHLYEVEEEYWKYAEAEVGQLVG